MSNILDANKIVSWCDCEGSTVEEKAKSIYEKIGAYFIVNAKRFSNDFAINTARVELNIILDHNEIITLNKKIEEYIIEEK